MASFKYIVTVQEPSSWTHDADGAPKRVAPDPIARGFDTSLSAIALASGKAHARPDGTTITIQRRRAKWQTVDGDAAGSQLVAFENAPWLLYRRYEVQGGVVRRVDR